MRTVKSTRLAVFLLAIMMVAAYFVPSDVLPGYGDAKRTGAQTAHAQEAVPDEEWKFDSSTGELQGFARGSSYDNPADLVIPEEINDEPVLSIGNQAFMYSTSSSSSKIKTPLSSITLPEGLEKIGRQAFQTSSRTNTATAISLPSTLTTLDYRAFFGWDKVKEVVFAEGMDLEEIGEAAFYSCQSLETVNLPDGLKTIGVDAFRDTSIKAIDIPDSVETIGATAFTLSLMREFTIPENVTSWSKKANGSDVTGTNVMFFRTAQDKVTSSTGYVSQGTLEFTVVHDSTGLATASNSGAVINPQPVTINYVDNEGNTIRESEEAVGAEYNKVDAVQGTYTIQYSLNEGGGDKHLLFDYVNPWPETTYVYSNSQGGKNWANALIGENYFTAGNEYELNPPKIPGYVSPAAQTKTITETDHEITFVYEPLPKVKLTVEGDGLTTDPAPGEITDESEVTITILEPSNKKLKKVTINDNDVTDLLDFDGIDYAYTFNMDGDAHVKVTYKEATNNIGLMFDKDEIDIGNSVAIDELTYRGEDVDITKETISFKEENGKKFKLDRAKKTILPMEAGTYEMTAYLTKHPDIKTTKEIEVDPIAVKIRFEDVHNTVLPRTEVIIDKLYFTKDVNYYTDLEFAAAVPALAAEKALSENLQVNTASKDEFNCSSTGNWMQTLGNSLWKNINDDGSFMLLVNDTTTDLGVGEYALKRNDDILIYYDENWMDTTKNAYFKTTEYNVNCGKEVEFELWSKVTSWVPPTYEPSTTDDPLPGAVIEITKPDGTSTVTEGFTDENGTIKCTFKGEGKYMISATMNDGSSISRPSAEVNVSHKPDSVSVEVTRKATTEKEGELTFTCGECHETWTEAIPVTKAPGTPTLTNVLANSKEKTNTGKWRTVSDATGYEMQWKTRGAANGPSVTVGNTYYAVARNQKVGSLYQYKVRAVKGETQSSEAATGKWSNTLYRYFYTVKKIRISGVKGGVSVGWQKDANATGYQILYSDSNKYTDGTGAKIVNVSKNATTKTVSGLKSGKTYYVQIRAIKKVGNTAYIGNISNPVAVKVK